MLSTQRFYLQVAQPDERGCCLWLGVVSPNGYGRFSYTDDTGHHFVYAHRLAWELARGLIPRGLVIDHLCRVRRCVNPAHLEPVTQRENVLRGEQPAVRAEACPRGHPLDGVRPGGSRAGMRYCTVCHREQTRESMRRARARRT